MKKIASTLLLSSLCVFAFGASVEKKVALDKYEGLKYSSDEIPTNKSNAAIPKNIIFIIGDGMGCGAYDAASVYCFGETNKLYMQQLPVSSLVKTRSRNNTVTDSAASGTAMSTGNKVNNGNIGGCSQKNAPFIPLKSIASFAQEQGKAIAIVTSDSSVGATPAAFYAHNPSRHDFAGIIMDQLSCGFEVVIGNKATYQWLRSTDNAEKVAKVKDSHVIVDGIDAIKAAPVDKKVIANLDNDFLNKETSVAEFMMASIERVEKDPDGFFMMVECCYPDKGGHSNDASKTVLGTIHIDYAIKAAVEYAAKNGDTLVVVTADHETGGITNVTRNETDLIVTYTTGSHTSADVPLYAFGPGADKFAGNIDNTEIPIKMADFWNIKLEKLEE
ncbi:MAG: alkaline phosphatase [Kiritimatiellae bacterium]|nr:alkaline phosphatase [Kiritimatiellia bacterium]